MTPTAPRAADPASERIYDRSFWMAYVANVALVTANALTFRFAELVAWLGGTERTAGTIVATGVAFGLIGRLFLGQAIDRYGTRLLWTANSVLFTVGCLGFLAAGDISWVLYAARVAFALGLGGMFTASIVYIQNRVPPARRTEVIGVLGSSGFVGMIIGSQLADAYFRFLPLSEATAVRWGRMFGLGEAAAISTMAGIQLRFVALFGTAALLGLFYIGVVVSLTRRDTHRRPYLTPAAHHLMARYWPGMVLLVAIMMGTAFAVTTVFLTRFATHLGLSGTGAFWTAYAVVAFTARLLTRQWSRTVGRHRMIVIGLLAHAAGFAMLPWIRWEWQFAFPAASCGFAHALLFPAVVSLGTGAFPRIFRGTGTTLILGFFDIGYMVSAPLLGWIIDSFSGGAGFTPMFLFASGWACFTAVTYALTAGRTHDEDLAAAQSPGEAFPGEQEERLLEQPVGP
jgi:MFS family permease